MKYSQPNFYHFSQDSIEFINFLKKENLLIGESLLDLGCGCGVIGIEAALTMEKLVKLSLVEMEEEYIDHIKANIKAVPEGISVKYKISTFSNIKPNYKHDLILCNPPYFSKGMGRRSPNEKKQRCRTFEVDSESVLVNKIQELLSEKGKAYIIFPDNALEWVALFEKTVKIKKIGKLSAVGVYSISK